jgi:hypothetical protein
MILNLNLCLRGWRSKVQKFGFVVETGHLLGINDRHPFFWFLDFENKTLIVALQIQVY